MRHFEIDLWEGGDGGAKGESRQAGNHPALSAYLLDGERERGAVLVIPGGAYAWVSPREAEPIAMRVLASGRHAFVLRYSVAPARWPAALLDAARAMRLIRAGAGGWHVSPSRVAALGFSAGGHLAASLAFMGGAPPVRGAPGVGESATRPDALGLAYPVASSGECAHRASFANLLGSNASDEDLAAQSLELRVPDDPPPLFLWHTAADESVPVRNSLLLAEAYAARRLPFELHVFPKGGHGLALATAETATPERPPEPRVARWTELFFSWLDETLPEPEPGRAQASQGDMPCSIRKK